METLLDKFQNIKVFVFDVDGVMTNGMLYVQDDGSLLRRMNIKDGYALQLAVKKGYQVWIISGGNSEGSKRRLEKLGVKECHFAVKNKAVLLQDLMQQYNVTNSDSVLYMGDDMPDIAPMALSGLKTCPNDACSDVLNIADYISPIIGGNGCVRDVIEKVLKPNFDWE